MSVEGRQETNRLPPRSSAWEGDAAETVAARVERAIEEYPWRERYRYWPGPNSNTFVQWVLGEEFVLPWRAHGRRYALR